MEKINENIENKYSQFLELLKTNPEVIESQAVKNEYKKLLEIAFENVKSDLYWDVVPELLKLNILKKGEIKEQYMELLKISFRYANYDSKYLRFVMPELLKLNILEKSDKERCKKLWETVFEKAKMDVDWANLAVNLLKLNILEKREIKEQYRELLKIAFEKAKMGVDWAKDVVPELLKLNILKKREIKEQYRDLLQVVFEKSKIDLHWAKFVVPELLKLNIKSDKERYKKLLKETFQEWKSNERWAKFVVPELLKLNIWDKSDKKRYENLLVTIFEEAKTNYYLAEDVVPELLKLNILEKSEIKERYRKFLESAFDKAKIDYYWAMYVIPKLLKLNILEKSDKERYNKLLKAAFDMAKYDYYIGGWAKNIVPELLKLNILEKLEVKEQYKEFLERAFEKAKSDEDWAKDVVPELLKLNILEKREIKEQYRDLLQVVFEKSKIDLHWAKFVVPELLKLNILEKREIKEQYKELLWFAFEKAKAEVYLVDIISDLLKLNILEKSDIARYNNLLEIAFENAKTDADWARAVVPELLKLNILEKSDKDITILGNITFILINFLEKNKDKIDEQDIEFMDQIDDCFSKEEIDYLYRQDYEYFKKIEIAVKEKDYEKIWEIKKNYYSGEEMEKIGELEKHFGKGIWTYFVDKVPGNKKLKNRFRDPHNALLRDITVFYHNYLDKNGVTKEDFLKNYLGVAGDRNNGYQQLNNFIEKGKHNWKELVQGAMNIDEFKENREFMNLAEGILEQEKTGELYKNLDNLEQILTLLHMIRNKESLIKLGKLANSDNPDDKKLYEYYKGAIYHPRTKPIIMKMYENPGEFLGLDDTTFYDLKGIHQAKKPLNMVENFEYLDFDAHDLVNCLPLGVYDKLSYFKPFEMKFYMSGGEVYSQNEIQDKITTFVDLADQKKITNIIRKLKEGGDETMWYQIWKVDKQKFVKELVSKYKLTDLIDLFITLGYSEFNKYKDLKLMTAKISPKSDPNNWFNGFNCDSLAEGHGKKVVAMFNPYCTDFCIYEGEQDPNEDNLKVTSWVTLNRTIPENFETLLDKVKSQTTHDVADVLGDKFDDYKDPSEYVITMDNIEANPNFGNKYATAVRKMYEKFFSAYIRENPMSPNGIPINTHKFYSGVNYNKIDILHKTVPNESLPVFVNAYSDNSKAYSLQGDLDAGEQKEKQKKVGIYPLSIEDVVQVSYMEGKIYPSSMKDHLGNLQHEITASILNNTLKGRENLSFARYNEEGKIGGYILSYQGKMEDGTPGIYISDFAIDKDERGTAGIRMIHHRIRQVKKYYPDMPVFTRARENTSYRMVKAFAGRQGYEIVEDELMQDGGENFHWVVMKPKK